MEFRTLTLDDYKIYQEYYEKAQYKGYLTNFSSLYLWNDAYNCKFYKNDHFLIVLAKYRDKYFFNLPLCEKQYFKEAIECIIDYCDTNKMPLMLYGVLLEQQQWLEEYFPGYFEFIHDQEYDNYIYDASLQRTLAGRKMQKRRNHYNAFKNMYENHAVYRSCTVNDKQQIMDLLERWEKDKEETYALDIEKKGIFNVLENLDKLPMKVGCIEIDGKMEAFIIGSLLNHKTVQIHVEKANREIRGIYVAILKYFLENEYPDALWINREEDMGIEMLRKAKMQMHPSELLHVGIAYRNNVVIRKACEKDKENLKYLWLERFKDDTDEFYEDYFQNVDKDIYVLEVDNRIVSTLYLRHVNLTNGEKAYYIQGVSTNPMYEGKGYMKKLLNHVLDFSNMYFLQAYNWGVYKSFDFKPLVTKHLTKLEKPLENIPKWQYKKGYDLEHFKNLYNSYISCFDMAALREKNMFKIMAEEAIYNDKAYCMYSFINGSCVVLETVYTDKNFAYGLINELIETYGKVKVLCEKDFLEGEDLLFLKYRGNEEINGSIFFNEYI